VFSLLGSAASAMTPLGLMIAGPVADTFGVQTWFVLGGLMTAGMGIAGYFIPAVVNIEINHRKSSQPEGESIQSAAQPVTLSQTAETD